MYKLHAMIAAVAMLPVSVAAPGQSRVDRAFTATGESCDQVTWSEEALEKYPNIASACQEVMERDGKYYVKFTGNVRRVEDRGRRITIDFKGGDQLALTPPENMTLYVDGQRRQPSALRRGDELTFYVPQEMLAESSPPAQVVGVTVIPLAGIRVAQAPETQTSETTELPRTAGLLPLIGLSGLLLTAFGAGLTLYRRSR
ncbi:MAG: hypothetical protein IRZ28_10210 [Steroidobacteraceae bacterium]|nr:hypothetical protein [Steroidobacteraceae bacterium]